MLLEDKYSEYFPDVSEEARHKLRAYFQMLLEYALTRGYIGRANNNEETLWLRHILDSLLVLNHAIPFRGSVADLGTGAGLPGIPLAIVLNELPFFLIDSSQKKINFLKKVKSTLKLDNIRLEAKNVGSMNLKKDLVIFRAFQKPLIALELSLYHLKEGGKIYYWRSNFFLDTGDMSLNTMIREKMKKFGLRLIDHRILKSPGELGPRGITLIEHFTAPQALYPRNVREIKKDLLNKKLRTL